MPDFSVLVADWVVPDGQLGSFNFRHGIVQAHVLPNSFCRHKRWSIFFHKKWSKQSGKDLLVESLFDVGHAFEVSRHIGAVLGSVLHFVLSGQVVQWVDGRVETGNGQKGSQVSSVRSDNDETKQPPSSGNQSTGKMLGGFSTTLQRISSPVMN